jgi:hypothetical protein
MVRASSRRQISYEKEMAAEEIALAMSYGSANLGVTKTRELMRLAYPERDCCGKVLNRLLQKGFDDHFGSDPHAMSKFMAKGDMIRLSGGVFEFELSKDGRITNIFIIRQCGRMSRRSAISLSMTGHTTFISTA